MTDQEQKYRKDMERGAKAEKLLQDSFLTEAFKQVNNSIHQSIEECPLRDVEGLVSLRTQLKCLEFIKGYLETALRDGNFAAEQVKRGERERAPLKLSDIRPLSHPDWRARA